MPVPVVYIEHIMVTYDILDDVTFLPDHWKFASYAPAVLSAQFALCGCVPVTNPSSFPDV